MKKLKVLIILFYPFVSFGLKESEIHKAYLLLKDPLFYQTGSWTGVKKQGAPSNKVTLRYARFGHGMGENGSLVFVNGWAENIYKYIELFYDLNEKGFSPIYTYDHRGQGFSDRILPDPSVGYVEDYSFYRQDLQTFIRIVTQDEEVNKDKLFLIAHSMGGLIAVDYLQTRSQQSYFKAVVLSSPMLRMEVFHPILSPIILGISNVVCWFDCLSSVPGINMEDMKKGIVTSSQAREKFSLDITKIFPGVTIERPSYHWILESFSAMDRVEREAQPIPVPLLILQSEEETLVSNSAQKDFCLSQNCQLKTLSGKHEHFMEKDAVRDQAIKETTNFFQKTTN